MALKYCLVTTEAATGTNPHSVNALDFRHWAQTFQGEICQAEALLPALKDGDYDLIHVAVRRDNLTVIKKVREKLGNPSRTKLALDFGQALSYWDGEAEDKALLKAVLASADFISATEYALALHLENLSEKKVYELPHPFDPRKLATYHADRKKGLVSFVYTEASLKLSRFELAFSLLGKRVRVLTFKDSPDCKRSGQAQAGAGRRTTCRTEEEFYKQIAESEFVFAPHASPGHGELVLYAAAAGTPVLGSLQLDVMRRCYPFTAVESLNLYTCLFFYLFLKIKHRFKRYIRQVAACRIACYTPENLLKKFLDFLFLETKDSRFSSTRPENSLNQKKETRKGPPVFHHDIRHDYGPEKVAYRPDECALVTLVKNGEEYIKTFIDHYCSLGVKHFYFIDNGSTDSTLASLEKYPAITVYRTRLEHKKYEAEIRQTVIEANCRNQWCLSVDIDELFDFPCSDVLSLGDFLHYLNACRYTAVVSYMLDMFPEGLTFGTAGEEEDWVQQHCYYDLSHLEKGNYYSHVKAFCNYNRLADPAMPYYYGGIRKKTFRHAEIKYLLIKHPLMFIDEKIDAVTNPHFCNKASIADVNGLIKHYKFLPTFRQKIQKACESYDFFAAREYKTYVKTLKKSHTLSLFSADARKLGSVNDLVQTNFLKVSRNYLDFVHNVKRNESKSVIPNEKQFSP